MIRAIPKISPNFFFLPILGALPTGKNNLAWLPLQSLAVKKNFLLCKFWAVKNFYNLLKSAGEIFLAA